MLSSVDLYPPETWYLTAPDRNNLAVVHKQDGSGQVPAPTVIVTFSLDLFSGHMQMFSYGVIYFFRFVSIIKTK